MPRLLLLLLFFLVGLHLSRAFNISTRYFIQPFDHFSFPQNPSYFKHRVLYNYDAYLAKGPVFFYFGNEANVELYVSHTGLMWENAKRFGAAIVFAEHRYYGTSRLYADGPSCDFAYLTTEQAMADYAVVIDAMKRELGASAVIGFGGSYGGMLATAFKFKYPHLVDGIIAASAPVLAYQGMIPNYEPSSYARVVTRDAGPECSAMVKAGLEEIDILGNSVTGRRRLGEEFNVCSTIRNADDARNLLSYAADHWNYLAMGDYPYPSSYVQPDGALLPAYPVRAACLLLMSERSNLVRGLAKAAEMFYNATGKHRCLFGEQSVGGRMSFTRLGRTARSRRSCAGSWDWQYCTEHNMPFSSGTQNDMFYPLSEFDPKESAKSCQKQFGIGPNPYWARETYGGLQGLQFGMRNTVFSNGYLDPWSAGGVLDARGFHPSVLVITIPNGAHHLDLMFSHPDDPEDVKRARQLELTAIQTWINEAKARTFSPEIIVEIK